MTDAAKRRVLVVDDDADIREIMQLMLELHGYEVDVAADGAEALEKLHQNGPPSLILLDLMMPGMNGLEFRAAQLDDPEFAGVPVVALTGAASVPIGAETQGLRVIRKPVPVHELIATVEQVAT